VPPAGERWLLQQAGGNDGHGPTRPGTGGLLASGYDDAVDAFATVRAVLATDLACDQTDLLAEGLRVVLAAERPARRRFPRGPTVLIVATMGTGTVVCCDASRLAWARAEFGQLDRDRIFSAATTARIAARVEADGQVLAGPDLKFVCAEQALRPAPAPEGVRIEVVDGQAVAALYQNPGFGHALSYLTGSPRPDMLAAVAHLGGEVGEPTLFAGRPR
jgi:hypothetical protein